jgi:hypothetical protein
MAQATTAQLKAAHLDELPLAPGDARVDLLAPSFSNSTNIRNPLFPISELQSAILNGRVEGKKFRTETTLLPETRIIGLGDGLCVEVLVSQYVAYLDGRIEEVALDHYAQADDGSVWYFGEDVFNYKNGVIADTGGTWLAGKEGPPAMIMPPDPQLGDVYRSENIPGLVFEEVTVNEIDKTVDGPHGPVLGAMVGGELHDDGTTEDKVFAPGYGEFFTAGGGDVEALALAVPTDALPGPTPAELEAMSSGADDIFVAMTSADWAAATDAGAAMASAWGTYQRTGDAPARLVAPTDRALRNLATALNDRDPAGTSATAFDVALATLDLQLPYRAPAEIDVARFELWARRIIIDAAAGDAAGVIGDVAVLEWIRDRIARTLDSVDLTRVDFQLLELRNNAGDQDLGAAARTASALRKILASL